MLAVKAGMLAGNWLVMESCRGEIGRGRGREREKGGRGQRGIGRGKREEGEEGEQ